MSPVAPRRSTPGAETTREQFFDGRGAFWYLHPGDDCDAGGYSDQRDRPAPLLADAHGIQEAHDAGVIDRSPAAEEWHLMPEYHEARRFPKERRKSRYNLTCSGNAIHRIP